MPDRSFFALVVSTKYDINTTHILLFLLLPGTHMVNIQGFVALLSIQHVHTLHGNESQTSAKREYPTPHILSYLNLILSYFPCDSNTHLQFFPIVREWWYYLSPTRLDMKDSLRDMNPNESRHLVSQACMRALKKREMVEV